MSLLLKKRRHDLYFSGLKKYVGQNLFFLVLYYSMSLPGLILWIKRRGILAAMCFLSPFAQPCYLILSYEVVHLNHLQLVTDLSKIKQLFMCVVLLSYVSFLTKKLAECRHVDTRISAFQQFSWAAHFDDVLHLPWSFAIFVEAFG